MHVTTIILAALGLGLGPAPATAAPTLTHAKDQPRTGPVHTVLNQTQPARLTPRDYNHGWCGLHYHVHQMGLRLLNTTMWINVYDAEQNLIAAGAGETENSLYGINSYVKGMLDLPLTFEAEPFSEDRDQVKFKYGDDVWSTGPPGQKNDRCSVGKFDYGADHILLVSFRQLDLDCGFAC